MSSAQSPQTQIDVRPSKIDHYLSNKLTPKKTAKHQQHQEGIRTTISPGTNSNQPFSSSRSAYRQHTRANGTPHKRSNPIRLKNPAGRAFGEPQRVKTPSCTLPDTVKIVKNTKLLKSKKNISSNIESLKIQR